MTRPEPLPPPNADLPRALVGIWNLVSREDYDRGGRRLIDPFLGPDPLGIVSFAPRHFAAQFMNRRRNAEAQPGAPEAATGRPAPSAEGAAAPARGAAPPAAPAAANNSSAVNGYDAYFGTYTVDAARGTIATRLEGALAAQNVGQVFTRDVRVVGDRLLIRLATNAADGTPITRTLTFERVG